MKRIYLLFTLPLLVVLASCSERSESTGNTYVDNGDKYYERSNLKEASIMYRRALQKNMKNSKAWYKLGLINLRNSALGEGEAI